MTEDKIIIDGVIVNECEDFSLMQRVAIHNGVKVISNACLQGCCTVPCKENPNCRYKQLKRKEEECEKWKSAYYNSTTEVKADLIQKVDELKDKLIWFEHYKQSALENKERCDKLIDELQTKKEKVKELEAKLKQCWDLHCKFIEKSDKYKQALEEISLIVTSNLCNDDCDECPSNCECDWKEVNDKIREVQNANI